MKEKQTRSENKLAIQTALSLPVSRGPLVSPPTVTGFFESKIKGCISGLRGQKLCEMYIHPRQPGQMTHTQSQGVPSTLRDSPKPDRPTECSVFCTHQAQVGKCISYFPSCLGRRKKRKRGKKKDKPLSHLWECCKILP